jgi:Protein of unknown function (DUF3455)
MFRNTTALTAALTFALLGGAQATEKIIPPAVPIDIEVPAGFKPFFVGHAVGTQNFICVAAATPTGGEWWPIGPQATIFDETGEQTLTHYQSKNPIKNNNLHATWQHSHDTSQVWATRFSGSLDPNYVAPGAIEWLRLDVTGGQVGPTGGDKLSSALFIQRVNTVGGVKPPAADCTSGTLNNRRLVDYEADYYFYR